ncbi:hypothetical protein MMC11_005429 [Xylographa trunciseda]|nr:hypothetical protein [Xylographa trunciseda]
MLENHLQQIALSAEAIAELPFPPPRIFTNALLHPHDITTLIRDTEAHERALFTVAPDSGSGEVNLSSLRKSVIFDFGTNGDGSRSTIGAYRGPRPTTAVGRLLGGDLMNELRKGGVDTGRDRSEVDVKLLLMGAEKLCAVYPIEGAIDKIDSLRMRYEQLTSSIERYEARVAKQASQLERLNQPKNYDHDERLLNEDHEALQEGQPGKVTVEDIQREEAEMKELEKKKRGLEDRVSGYERDIGGLLR